MKRKDDPDKLNASRFLEYGSMIMALVSAIWLVVTMTQVTFPGFDARLLPPLLILLIAGAVWGITLVRDEAKRLGWTGWPSPLLSLCCWPSFSPSLFRGCCHDD